MNGTQYKLTGTAALIWGVVSLAISVWMIYFVIKIAQHVNAWPF